MTHSTHGSSTQVDEQSKQIGALKKQLAHVKESFEQTAPNDGGAADLTSAKATAKGAITQAVTTMKTSVTDGFTTSKAAVVELEGAISTVERTIPTTELESIKVKSDEWCSSKTALDTAINEHTAAVIEFNNAAAPTLDPSLLAMSNFGPVTTCDLSVGESEACSTSWSCNLAQIVENAISAARTTYHTAIWDKKNKEDTKDTATETNTGKQSSFLTAIETTIAAEIAHCTGNDNIHASAVNAFNAVNTDRAAMYRQLTVVQCHVNHLDESDTSAVAVPEAATVGDTSTSAVDCVSKIKTKAQIKSSRFPDEALSGHASTCPTQTAYMNQIKAYGHPDMNLSDQWTPGATTCASVASHGGSSNAFSYVSNGAACSTECGQAGSEVVKYNCAKNDATVVDTANCVGLTLPTDYTETCAATAACVTTAVLGIASCDGYTQSAHPCTNTYDSDPSSKIRVDGAAGKSMTWTLQSPSEISVVHMVYTPRYNPIVLEVQAIVNGMPQAVTNPTSPALPGSWTGNTLTMPNVATSFISDYDISFDPVPNAEGFKLVWVMAHDNHVELKDIKIEGI